MIANWIMGAAGVWAIASPWILGFSSISIAKWNSLILGLVLVITNAWTIFEGANTIYKGVTEPEKGRDDEKQNHKS